MISYTEKGAGLHAAIGAAGHSLWCADGEWMSSDDAAVQALIDGFDELAWAQDLKWNEIKAKREAVKYFGVFISSVARVIDTDEGARTQQLGLVMMGSAIPAGLEWKFADNSFVAMTPALAQEIMVTTATRDMAVFAVGESYRQQIGGMSDWQAVLALDITAGWPS